MFRLGTVLTRWWEHLYWQVADPLYRQRRRHHATGGCLAAVSLSAFAGAVGWSAWAVLGGGLSAGQFAATLIALRQARTGVDHLVNRMSFLAIQLLNIADLFIYLDLGPEDPPGGARFATLKTDAIATRDLSFRYPQAEQHALSGVSLTIRPGERVALVGANGSGKTTLVKLLMGLFRPTAGELDYGDLPASCTNPDALWNRSTAVFQDYTRFAFTLGENIGFGRWERMQEPGEIERAARRGGADAVAGRLPDGYETPLGREFEGGTELSGGEWQRVAISRGFMRDADLVVLDEPTASLDPKAEADVFRRFLAMAGGRTTIVVSHRLGSARLCDRILVLREGRLVEEGSHDELVAGNGEYARMWALQAGWYEG